MLRALGRSLADKGVPGALANPLIQVFLGQRLIASNDDWERDASVAAVAASGLAPEDSQEAAMVMTLEPGAYTMVVRGRDRNQAGVTLSPTGVGQVAINVLDDRNAVP